MCHIFHNCMNSLEVQMVCNLVQALEVCQELLLLLDCEPDDGEGPP